MGAVDFVWVTCSNSLLQSRHRCAQDRKARAELCPFLNKDLSDVLFGHCRDYDIGGVSVFSLRIAMVGDRRSLMVILLVVYPVLRAVGLLFIAVE